MTASPSSARRSPARPCSAASSTAPSTGCSSRSAFLTGVTEPLEFSFMFVAFPLYALHAVLTGTSLAVVNALGIKDGFSFSAGFFDYVLNFNIATKPLWLIPIGLVYAVIYYFGFRW